MKTNRTTHETQPEQELTDDQFFAGMNGGLMMNGARGSTPEAMHSQRRSALRARANIAAEAAGHLPGNQTPPQSSPSFINTTY
jgi:SWI/SNF-related matrix-associated actin-dependent regulator of chromatin subfamily B protein 1